MAKTMYAQGYAFENRIVRKLNAKYVNTLGWKGLAYRTAGSHSPVDITYTNLNSVYLIQCKHSKKKDVDLHSILCDNNTLALQDLLVPFNVIKVLLIKQARSRDVIQLRYNDEIKPGKWQLINVFDLK